MLYNLPQNPVSTIFAKICRRFSVAPTQTIFVLKHCTENKEKYFDTIWGKGEENNALYPMFRKNMCKKDGPNKTTAVLHLHCIPLNVFAKGKSGTTYMLLTN